MNPTYDCHHLLDSATLQLPLLKRCLCQKLLGADKPILYMDSVGAFNNTRGTIAAAHVTNFFREISETHDGLMVVAAEVMIRKETQHIRYGHALGALSLALVAHTAVFRPDLFVH